MGKFKDDNEALRDWKSLSQKEEFDEAMELWPVEDGDRGLTEAELADMRTRALISDLSGIIDLIDEKLVNWQYYDHPITADSLREVRAELRRLTKNYD